MSKYDKNKNILTEEKKIVIGKRARKTSKIN